MKEALITLEDEVLMINGDSMDSEFNTTQGLGRLEMLN